MHSVQSAVFPEGLLYARSLLQLPQPVEGVLGRGDLVRDGFYEQSTSVSLKHCVPLQSLFRVYFLVPLWQCLRRP